MNYTENYQLPQWEETDRVLRTDFNEAMKKIESGILSRLGMELLRESSTTGQVQRLDIDVSDLSLSQYRLIIIEYLFHGDAFCGLLANESGGSSLTNIGMMETLPNIPGHAILFPFGNADATVRCLGLGAGTGFGTANVSYGEIHTLTFIAKNEQLSIGGGSTARIYGVR